MRARDADPAEAALCCAAAADGPVDVDVELLRLDALADDLRTRGFPTTDTVAQAAALRGHLHGALGFTGDTDDYHHPHNSLLHHVLRRRRGMPITLSIVYLAIARRLRAPAFGVGLPGHFVAAVGPVGRAVVIDPFDAGRVVGDADLAALVERTTGGRATFSPRMVRPAPLSAIVRRLLDNLTRDRAARGDVDGALRTLELQQLLPDPRPDDLRTRGELLARAGRYDEAAAALEAYAGQPGTDEAAAIRLARRARAKLN